ncbi:hypothetical protein PVAND_004483 [Polypedilum vanderplanki]|uniref:Reverse transcriptase domain-containing protein n=1 Tax=Polypedilum vanderplanki TaxID=319348 RepID=A0A9J6BX41_POLVA|nr:hypothetical protein PVAND_004483 [Polypedilum vanderplanki]
MQFKDDSFFCGDYNSKHRFWNCFVANRAGTLLYNELSSNNLNLFYPDEHTYFPLDPTRKPSTIDLVLSNNHYNISPTIVSELISDHAAITFEIITQSQTHEQIHRKQLDFSRANWSAYRKILNIDFPIILQTNINTINDIDARVDSFTSSILEARNTTIPCLVKNPYKLNLPDELINLIKLKNSLKCNWRRNRDPTLKTVINHYERQIKYSISMIRNENWAKKLSNISPSNQSIWKTARLLKCGNKNIPPIETENGFAISNVDKANKLAETFSQNHENPLHRVRSMTDYTVKHSVNTFINQNITLDTSDSLPLPTLDEVKEAVKSLPNNKAPGNDDIKNCLLKQLPPMGFEILLTIFIACFKLGYFPKKWKHARITPICKPQKDPKKSTSYRPISLLSSISKVLEKLILAKINKHCNDNNIIPPTQHGFRTGYSTLHQLKRVIGHASFGLQNKMSTGLITLDVEKAFDRVWYQALIYKMINLKFHPTIIKIINSFLNA